METDKLFRSEWKHCRLPKVFRWFGSTKWKWKNKQMHKGRNVGEHDWSTVELPSWTEQCHTLQIEKRKKGGYTILQWQLTGAGTQKHLIIFLGGGTLKFRPLWCAAMSMIQFSFEVHNNAVYSFSIGLDWLNSSSNRCAGCDQRPAFIAVNLTHSAKNERRACCVFVGVWWGFRGPVHRSKDDAMVALSYFKQVGRPGQVESKQCFFPLISILSKRSHSNNRKTKLQSFVDIKQVIDR